MHREDIHDEQPRSRTKELWGRLKRESKPEQRNKISVSNEISRTLSPTVDDSSPSFRRVERRFPKTEERAGFEDAPERLFSADEPGNRIPLTPRRRGARHLLQKIFSNEGNVGSMKGMDFLTSPVTPCGGDDAFQTATVLSRDLETQNRSMLTIPEALRDIHQTSVWSGDLGSKYNGEVRRLLSGRANCAFADYNINTWSEDVLTLPHNAVRCELLDMHTMFDAMLKIGDRLNYGDIYRMTKWFDTFSGFLKAVCVHESKVLFPIILEAKETDPNVTNMIDLFQRQQSKIESERNNTDNAFKEISILVSSETTKSQTITEKLTKCIESATLLGSHLIEYYRSQELYLPGPLYDHHQECSLKSFLHSKLVHDMMHSETSKINTVALIRWIQRKEDLQRFLQVYAPSILKSQYMRWQKKFQLRHRKIVEDMVAKRRATG